MVEVGSRKKATLSNKLMQAHLSNVKESFYMFDYTKCVGTQIKNAIINYQIETLLSSKLYGAVIVISFRNYEQELRFDKQEFQTKFSGRALAQNLEKIEVSGAPVIHKGFTLPGKKEKISVCHIDNFILVNVSPCLSKTDPTSVYSYLRSQTRPADALLDLV